MKKTFEDYFSTLQTDMVAIALEYVDNQADKIYIYCSYEPTMYSFNVFYEISGEIVHKHKLNDLSESTYQYDISKERQRTLLKIGTENLKSIHSYCKEFNQEMPTEMKLCYDVQRNKLEGKYRYDLIYTHDDDLLPMNIFNQWYAEIKNRVK